MGKQEILLLLIEKLLQSDESTEPATTSKQGNERAVVAFANNCIIFGYSKDYELGQITINQARYCYYYAKRNAGEEKGFMALAKYGPADGSKVSGPVDNVTVDACCIIDATVGAVNVWENSKWVS
ncbi:MAG: hypothetical protein JKX91_06395 [Rhizobiaceae bacterium]|nr:hypothetical protein [Rhizobiaceae bacterium]